MLDKQRYGNIFAYFFKLLSRISHVHLYDESFVSWEPRPYDIVTRLCLNYICPVYCYNERSLYIYQHYLLLINTY